MGEIVKDSLDVAKTVSLYARDEDIQFLKEETTVIVPSAGITDYAIKFSRSKQKEYFKIWHTFRGVRHRTYHVRLL